MHYRRLSYRYAAEMHQGLAPWPLGGPWGGRLNVGAARPEWRPPVDLQETDEALIIKAEIAGMSEEDFEIALYEDTLVIAGERPWEQCDGVPRFHVAEIRYGPFRLELPLPPALDRERIDAHYEAGFLTVTLPKRAPER